VAASRRLQAHENCTTNPVEGHTAPVAFFHSLDRFDLGLQFGNLCFCIFELGCKDSRIVSQAINSRSRLRKRLPGLLEFGDQCVTFGDRLSDDQLRGFFVHKIRRLDPAFRAVRQSYAGVAAATNQDLHGLTTIEKPKRPITRILRPVQAKPEIVGDVSRLRGRNERQQRENPNNQTHTRSPMPDASVLHRQLPAV
jgi:hypothetical protein